MKNWNVYFQLVPEYKHWRNTAEQEIRIWKNNFLAVNSIVDDVFPMNLWDQILYQVD